jgi:hypothetical protein
MESTIFYFVLIEMSRAEVEEEEAFERSDEGEQDPHGPPRSAKFASGTGKMKGPSKGKSDDKSRAQMDLGVSLSTIISGAGKDTKWKPHFDSLASAQAWVDTKRYSKKHKDPKLRGKPIYTVYYTVSVMRVTWIKMEIVKWLLDEIRTNSFI